MVSLAPVSFLLALVLVVNAASFRDDSPSEPEGPLDAPGPVGIRPLPAKLPDDWPRPTPGNYETGGKQRREATDKKTTDNRPVIKPQSEYKPSTQPRPQASRPARESPTPPPRQGQKPQPLPATPNQHKPQTLPVHPGPNGNRQGLTKPAPLPVKPAQSNTQKPQTQPGLAGNRQGLTKPAPLPAHARTQRHALEEDPKPQVLPAIAGTQKPQILPAPIENEKPQTQPVFPEGEKPAVRPPPVEPLRPQTIPAYVGSTVKPMTIPAIVNPRPPLVLVDPVPPHLANQFPADRPERDTPQSGENKPQTFPALVSPPKPQTPETLPAIGTQPVLTGNRESFLRPAPLPAHSESSEKPGVLISILIHPKGPRPLPNFNSTSFNEFPMDVSRHPTNVKATN